MKNIFILICVWSILFGNPCHPRAADDAPPVALYDTHGRENPAQWEKITGTTHTFRQPDHIVFENGLFRVTYPFLRDSQQAGHSYFVNVRGAWQRVTNLDHGDYVYFVDSVQRPPTNIAIRVNTPQEVCLEFTYQHKNYQADGHLKWAYRGDLRLTKRMSLQRAMPGVFVKLSSLPPNPKGEREIGFGSSSPLVYSEQVIAQHPVAGWHVDLRMKGAQRQYAVSLPLADSFYRLLALSRPMLTYSYQFNANEYGRLTVNELIESETDRYQAFLGAVPFDSSLLRVEAETCPTQLTPDADEAASQGRLLHLAAPQAALTFPLTLTRAGQYRVALRWRGLAYRNVLKLQIDNDPPRSVELSQTPGFVHVTLADERAFTVGAHTVTVTLLHGGLDLDNLVILPLLAAEQDFPLDIMSRVLPQLLPDQYKIEAETCKQRIGRNVLDPLASGGSARRAAAQQDQPQWFVWTPPALVVEPGAYRARFVLKTMPNNTPPHAPAARLEVFSRPLGILAKESVPAAETAYHPRDLRFTIPAAYPRRAYPLECRIYFTGRADVTVDYIELQRISD